MIFFLLFFCLGSYITFSFVMKVAEVKGIRLIMGAAKDERGSVFCNTNRWEVL